MLPSKDAALVVPPRRTARAVAGAALLAASLLVQAWARSFPQEVEAHFSQGLYPRIGGLLGRVAGLLPFSLAEGLVLATVLFLAGAAVRSVGRALLGHVRLAAVLATWAANLTFVTGLGYALFVLLWGLNYARPPLSSLAGLPVVPASTRELGELATFLIDTSNHEREGLPEAASGALRIDGGFWSVARRVALGYASAGDRLPLLSGAPAPPKPVVLSGLLSRAGITGIYFPFTGEPNVNTTIPDAELPFSAAHEVAHQLGFAREDEANYVGYLACHLHPDPDFRYAGLLAASHYVLSALHAVNPAAAAEILARRSPAVLRDEAALWAWTLRYRGRASEVGRRVNDAYLKTQGQTEGVRSYGRMIDLLLAERRRDGVRSRIDPSG